MNCQCPRCGSRSLETLETYSHCANCLYFEDHYEDVQAQVFKAVLIEREVFHETEVNLDSADASREFRKSA